MKIAHTTFVFQGLTGRATRVVYSHARLTDIHPGGTVKVSALAIVLAAALSVSARRAAAQAPDGQAVFHDECRTCHGVAGKPTQRAVKLYKGMPTFDAKFFAGRSLDSVVAVLNHGAGKDMKSFKDKLSPAEIAAVAKYVKDTFGASPGA